MSKRRKLEDRLYALTGLTKLERKSLHDFVVEIAEERQRAQFAIEQGFFDEHNETLFQIWRSR